MKWNYLRTLSFKWIRRDNVNQLILNQIPHLYDFQLTALALDCEHRIGSHVAGGEPNEHYVESQRAILLAIQEEMAKRRNKQSSY